MNDGEDAPIDRGKTAYSGGPVVKADPSNGAVPFEPLAIYLEQTEKARERNAEMIGTAAIIKADYGKGLIIAHSCHPERAPGPQRWFYQSLRMVAPQHRED